MFKKKLSIKLIASLSVLIMFIFLVSGYATFKVYLGLFTTEISKQFAKANEQAAARVDFQIQNITKSTNHIVFQPYIEDVLRRSAERGDNTLYNRILDQGELSQLLNQISIDEPKLSSMYVYNTKGSGYFFENNSGTVIPLGEDNYAAILKSLEGSNGELVWLPLRIRSIESSGFRNVISASLYMKNKQQELYGNLILLFDESIFGSILGELTEGESAQVFLLDKNGKTFYSNKTKDNRDLQELLRISESQMIHPNQEPIFVSRNKAEQSGITLISALSLQSINKQSRVIFQIALYSGLASVICASLLIFFTGKRLLNPLHVLVEGMTRLRRGKFDTRIRISTQDELAFLGQSFNEMAANIEALVKEVYERKLHEREAELIALQAQLNPHFLYNTLDTIYMKMFMGENDEQAAELVLSLSGILRYALQNPNTRTTVKDEIDHISKYMNIQSVRIGGRLETFIQVDEDAEQVPIIRLILQPLVENAFVHAFAHTSKICILRIKVKLLQKRAGMLEGSKSATGVGDAPSEYEGAGQANPSEHHGAGQANPMEATFLCIEVSDNGKGISEAQLEKLKRLQIGQLEEASDSSSGGIGLKTVIRRVSLLYGPPYGLEIESEPGSGTTMRLILPVQLAAQPPANKPEQPSA